MHKKIVAPTILSIISLLLLASSLQYLSKNTSPVPIESGQEFKTVISKTDTSPFNTTGGKQLSDRFSRDKQTGFQLPDDKKFDDKPLVVIPEAEVGNRNMPQDFVFIEDAKNNLVIVINKEGEILNKIKVGSKPHDISASPDGTFVATANFGDGTVSIIDTQSLDLKKTLLTGNGAHGLSFSPDGSFLFVVNAFDDTLSIIETETFSQQKKIDVGSYPEYVGVTQDGLFIFTTNLGGNGSVTLVENKGFSSEQLKTLELGIDPHGWALSPDGKKVVITNLGSQYAHILDASTFEDLGRIDTGATSEFASFRSNTELWVTNIGIDYVSVIDVLENTIIDKISVGPKPHGISFSTDGKRAFITLYERGEVVIIDTTSREIIKEVKIGEELHNSVVVNINQAKKDH